MNLIKYENSILKQWAFPGVISVFYTKNDDFCSDWQRAIQNEQTKVRPKTIQQEYTESVSVQRTINSDKETIDFNLCLIARTGSEIKFIFKGIEEQLKKFISGELDEVTREEYDNLPIYVRTILERKDYKVVSSEK